MEGDVSLICAADVANIQSQCCGKKLKRDTFYKTNYTAKLSKCHYKHYIV